MYRFCIPNRPQKAKQLQGIFVYIRIEGAVGSPKFYHIKDIKTLSL
jgi:hypothetical protein